MTPPTYTASQLARALGITKRAVLQELGSTPAALVQGHGGATKTWPVDALPSSYRERLAIQAKRRGCRDAGHYLATATARWTAPVPVAAIASKWMDQAAQLRDALAAPVQQQHELPPADLLELGLAEYRRTFGHAISGKQWRRLFDRTVERDGGREDWQRLEIYLAGAALARPAKPKPIKTRFDHRPISQAIESMANRAEPTAADRAWLFHNVFLNLEHLTGADADERAGREVKGSLLTYLLAVFPPPALSKSRPALSRTFDRKLQQWREGGRTAAALEDNRPVRSGNHRRPDFSDDEVKIRDLAIQLDGNESLAHLMLRERGELSEAFCAYYDYSPRTAKSRVPAIVRGNITNAVDFTLPLRSGERALRHAGPWTDRDWDEVEPGDWFVPDDVTWNHLYSEPNPAGGHYILRGENLFMADAKSDYAIEYLQIPGHYNSEHIIRLFLKTHDSVGLPRRGFIRERGVWSGKLVKGLGAGAVPLGETVRAFAQAMPGLRFHVSTTPRSKPVESLFGRVQERMRCLPGFVGFNERTYRSEAVQKLIARARRGDPEALAFFPTAEEWRQRINSVLEEFRNSPQNGKRLRGQSPAEAWNAAMKLRPLHKLADDTRYTLATHCVPARLTSKGIVVTVRGSHRRCYANEHTGAWFARGITDVLAFYNVEQPDLLIVTDKDRRQRFAVKALSLPAMSATREQLAEVAAPKRAHLAPARAIFGNIQHHTVSNITRDDIHDETTKDLGRFHNATVAEHQAAEGEEARMLRRARELKRELGERDDDLATSRVPLPRLLESLERKAARRRGQSITTA